MSQTNTPTQVSIEQKLHNGNVNQGTCFEHTTIRGLTSSFVAHIEDWKITSFNDSALSTVPVLSGLGNGDQVILELHHPQREVQKELTAQIETISLSNTVPIYCMIDSSIHGEGADLRTFELATTDAFGDYYPNKCLNALLACQIATQASTKLQSAEKNTLIQQIANDHAFVWSFIKQVICTPANELTDEVSAAIELVTIALIQNSKWYWSHLADHKASDFEFNLNK